MRHIIILLMILLSYEYSYSQYENLFQPKGSQVAGGIGLSWIDGEPYYAFNFTPDIAVGKFGVGLDVNIRIDKNGNIRSEDFKDFSSYLALIKYVRYGYKGDDLFIKLGGLDWVDLGYGNIISNYSNRTVYDNRKIGLQFDFNATSYGMESIYSDFSGAGILGLRGYVKPLSNSALPIIKGLKVGASFVSDFNEYSGVTRAEYDKTLYKVKKLNDEGSLIVLGLDMGLPLFEFGIVKSDLYSTYTKFLKFGDGANVGINFTFNFLNSLTMNVNFERWFNGDKFIPHYFDQFYEVDRFRTDTTTGKVFTKVFSLDSLKSVGNSWRGALGFNILNIIRIYGYYSRFDEISNSGRLQLHTDLSPENSSIVARAFYDKVNISEEKDIFTLDDRSTLTFELGYKPLPYIVTSIVYIWTFAPERDKDNKVLGYKTQKRVEPRVSFIFPFDLGSSQGKR